MTRPTAALAEMHTAIRAALGADGPLGLLVQGRIHDGPPKTSVTPWLAVTDARAVDWSNGDTQGARVQLTLEALSTDAGRGQALAIAERAADVIEAAGLTVTTGTLVLLRIGAAQLERLRDGRTWRARVTIEALIDG